MRLATFNIKNGQDTAGVVDNEGLAVACAALRADVLALQEVDVGAPRSGEVDQAAEVAGACGLIHVFAAALEPEAGGRYGNALLARGSIDDHEVVTLPAAPGRQNRVAIVAGVSVDDATLAVAATHLQNRPHRAPLVPRDADEQLEELAVVLEAITGRPRPPVILGDLNMGPMVAEPVLERAGFVVADTSPTVPARAPAVRIDSVAVDGLRVVSSEVVASPISDHRAVVVEVAT